MLVCTQNWDFLTVYDTKFRLTVAPTSLVKQSPACDKAAALSSLCSAGVPLSKTLKLKGAEKHQKPVRMDDGERIQMWGTDESQEVEGYLSFIYF